MELPPDDVPRAELNAWQRTRADSDSLSPRRVLHVADGEWRHPSTLYAPCGVTGWGHRRWRPLPARPCVRSFM
jgi:hypothetical protein